MTNLGQARLNELVENDSQEKLILALPKGRILQAIRPVMEHAGLIPEDGFFNEKDRRLRFTT
ncbi:MAG TPA: hypothetical protein DIT62_08265, partial [Alphaproteobacteria bacterium]|nr:hypothetical protein [Alphaproteobacteria bacterium]